MPFEAFRRSVDRLKEFSAYFDSLPAAALSSISIELEREELSEIWKSVKTHFDQCLASTRVPTNLELLVGDDNEAERTATEEQIKTQYREAHVAYIRCMSNVNRTALEYTAFVPNGHNSTHAPVPPGAASANLPSTPLVAPSMASDITAHFRVPVCDVEVFSGDYLTWPTFRDLFSALYIRNSHLSRVQVLYYLLQKTTGDAKELIRNVPLTNDGFDIAWGNLTAQYENKRILINRQLKTLFNLPQCGSESSEEIRKLQREMNTCISTLELYQVDVQNWDAIFVFLCCSRLPRMSLSLWEHSIQNKTEIPKWKDLDNFLTDRYHTLEHVSDAQSTLSNLKLDKTQSKGRNVNAHHGQVDKTSCIICKEDHALRHCPQFVSKKASERFDIVKAHQFCINCLSPAHLVKNCKSKFRCIYCKKSHHSLLHKEQREETSPPVEQSDPNTSSHAISHSAQLLIDQPNFIQPTSESELETINSCFASLSNRVLLGTAIINICHLGVDFRARALIDPGSEASFVTERIRRLLQLPFKSCSASVSGVSGAVGSRATKLATFSISSPLLANVSFQATALVVPQITGNLPSFTFTPNLSMLPKDLTFADAQFHKGSQIDILIGADYYPLVIKEGVRTNVLGSLLAQETIFGWVLTGPIPSAPHLSPNVQITACHTEISLNDQIAKFWEIEDIPRSQLLSEEEQICENLFQNTTIRDSNGRYIVDLPFKTQNIQEVPLGHSRSSALFQFLRNEKSHLKKPAFKAQYDEVISEYAVLNHMRMVPPPTPDFKTFYLPHHAVVKPSSTTTKIRVVFNASAPSSNGSSLNDVLYPGPALQADLTTLILRWRFYRYVFCADIEKMYRQILVNPNHTPFQRIVFRDSPHNPVQDFELQTVTFGVNCAPYLAMRVLRQLAYDEKERYPLASQVLLKAMYVDDVLGGAHSISVAIETRKQLIDSLLTAGFNLRKWMANDKEIIQDLAPEYLFDKDFLNLEDKSTAKTLGVRWNAITDSFYFEAQPFDNNPDVTKREVLRCIAKLFDPAGWLAPIIVKAKIIMQQIWLDNIDWDETLTPETKERWRSFLSTYNQIECLSIPRWLNFSEDSSIEFHGFCDASEKAYAATLYIRVRHPTNEVSTTLLLAKTKVAPLKSLSMPRLELCGALLLAEMVQGFLSQMELENYSTHFWTDSNIVLCWLRKHPSCLKTFEANRVAKILESVGNENWKHIESESNPADLATRGCSPLELKTSNLWWQGPSWLAEETTKWPISNVNFEVLDPPGMKMNVQTHASLIQEDLLVRFSSLARALRVIVYIFRLRFCLNRYRTTTVFCRTGPISTAELQFVKHRLVYCSQHLYFSSEIDSLTKKENLSPQSQILSLNPFLDEDGILRANGRLTQSPLLPYSEQYPIILAYKSPLSRLLVEFIHKITLHGGHQLVCRLVRLEYFILKLKNLIKTVLHGCKICVLDRKRLCSQVMAPLPEERVTISVPFNDTGIDFAGPFDISRFSGRGSRTTKGYVCLFVCFSTKAIHLEATSDLSTRTFLDALTRFTARRGCPANIYTDNGTNFLGASRALKREAQAFLSSIRDETETQYGFQNIRWNFIPASAPHMGGLWEAGVRSFKTHFRKIAKDCRYTFEEFATLLSRIEAVLNSRPLCPQSNNASDLTAITAGHFLTGRALLSPAHATLNDTTSSMLNRWQKQKALYQRFCLRWKTEYLHELHRRNKWKLPTRDIQVDDLVVIHDEATQPLEWRLGRVQKTFPGRDNHVRVAEVLTQRGPITRAVHKLVLLPSKE